MTIPIPALLVLFGLIVAAKTRLNAVVAGQPVSVPVLWLVALALVLLLVALVLLLIRSAARNGAFLYLRPWTVNA